MEHDPRAASVASARNAHEHGSNARLHLTLREIAVPHYLSPTLVVQRGIIRCEEGGKLGFHRAGDEFSGAVTQQFCQRIRDLWLSDRD